ncbi:hypothetical protein [Fulvivirga aurantia]|uniref:hypothetical protein n=1 Tax=Fulvivirga aurantia TaxID=2529383 RepID=UPI0012BB7090|nr:hypothetical protein [Fulvivirga aurantia]
MEKLHLRFKDGKEEQLKLDDIHSSYPYLTLMREDLNFLQSGGTLYYYGVKINLLSA